MSALIMIVSAAAVLLFVRYGLVAGIEKLADALSWSSKTRGQATGFATSAPELVTLVAAGLSGVWEAGLWNIASSNIINASLMLFAVGRYKQWAELRNRRFFDEVTFAALAVVVPIALMQLSLDTHWSLVPGLIGFFFVYRVVDKRLNPAGAHDHSADEAVGSLKLGLIMTLTALLSIAIAGVFLGSATETVVREMGIHPAIAGWILGFMTSLPEMVTFFAVYATAKREGRLGQLDDTQEVLDNLTASNMANVGIVYPLGLAAYLVAIALGV